MSNGNYKFLRDFVSDDREESIDSQEEYENVLDRLIFEEKWDLVFNYFKSKENRITREQTKKDCLEYKKYKVRLYITYSLTLSFFINEYS